MKSVISVELNKCHQYAERGYQEAQQEYEKLYQVLREEKKRIEVAERQQQNLERIHEQLGKQQMRDINRLQKARKSIKQDIDHLYDQMKDFSVVLYGRTMTGKSTLMEIMTHGNGKSIGHGAQRTTLDVRSYYWEGLKITDVPGIGSFDGREDDRLAFGAAKAADLVLFLITDDAPQAEEAKHLADLRQLGKPVLGIVNVKMAINPAQKKLALRNLQKRLSDTERLDAVCKQFKAYAKRYGQDWSQIPFVYTHLNAAFMGQPERSNDQELYEASGFPVVEQYILDKVCRDGCFIRSKTFKDSVAVPMQKIATKLYEHSAENLKISEVYAGKLDELWTWKANFIKMCEREVSHVFDCLENTLHDEAYSFAESHYEDQNAGKAWQDVLQSLELEDICKLLLQKLADECENKRRELSDELTQEMCYTFDGEFGSSICMEDITDTKSFMQTVGTGAALFFGGPIGGALFMAISSIFMDSKEEKIKQAKKELRNKLDEANSKMLEQMKDTIIDVITEKILGVGVNGLADNLTEMEHIFIRLADNQSNLAGSILNRFCEISLGLVQEACTYVGCEGFSVVKGFARIPGEKCCIVSSYGCANQDAVASLLGEQVEIFDPWEDNDAFISWLEKMIKQKIEISCYLLDDDDDDDDEYTVFAMKLPLARLTATEYRPVRMWQQIARVPMLDNSK